MTVLSLAAAILLIFVAGWSVLSLIGRGTKIERLALGWVVGCGAISLLLFIVGFFLAGLSLQLTVTAIVVLGAILARQRRTSERSRSAETLRPDSACDPLDWMLVAIIAAELATVFIASFGHTLGWDGLLNWEIKARYAWLNGGHLPGAYYSDAGRLFSHPEYPLCVPLSELWLYLWLGDPNQFAAKIIFPLFFVSGVVLLALIAGQLSGSRKTGLAIGALCPLVPYLTAGAGGVLVGYVDWSLATCYLAAVGYLALFLRDGSLSHFRLYALSVGLLPWFKREGTILWVLLAATTAVILWRKRALRRNGSALLPGLLLIVTWRAYLSLNHTLPSHDFIPITSGAIATALRRAPSVAAELGLEMIRLGEWNIFWPVVFASSAYLILRRREPGSRVLFLAVVVPLTLFSATYCLSAWTSYIDHIHTSLPRLIMQVLPVGWLLIALAVRASAAPPVNGPACQSAKPS